MPRVARIVVPGCPHHVTQRGNNRQDVFFVEDDWRTYLRILREQSKRFGLSVDGYCLMTNHVHLVAVPTTENSLAKAVGRTHWLYTQYVNRLHRRSGHLWQNRFFSCALDESHCWQALAYVERNPVRAPLVRKAWRWPWSSAAAHAGGTDATGLLDLARWRGRHPPQAWREVLQSAADEDQLRVVREGVVRGRPLGSDRWLAKLETALDRRLRPLPVGRPPKRRHQK